jgi:hypothetical protein
LAARFQINPWYPPTLFNQDIYDQFLQLSGRGLSNVSTGGNSVYCV